jgi:DNA processing protein
MPPVTAALRSRYPEDPAWSLCLGATVSAADDRFELAAWVHQAGRRHVAEHLAAGVAPSRGLADAPPPRLDAKRLRQRCEGRGIRLLVPDDGEFPASLRNVPDPPLLLYVRGDSAALCPPAVAVIGARRCSRLGREVAEVLAGELAGRGVVVVSGLARGIDGAAHRGALRGGRTCAVLGCGLERAYPAEHSALADAVLEGGGALVSEYLPWAMPRPFYFPERNRLISGLVAGVVVVEAGEQSGSLITARMALEQGREVMAVPGPAGSATSRGCHRLLRQGAALVESAEDVFEALGWAWQTQAASGDAPAPENVRLARVLAAVDGSGCSLDRIAGAAGVSAATAAAALVELELAGFVRQVPGGYIRRPFS